MKSLLNLLIYFLTFIAFPIMAELSDKKTLRIATFNVSMEALNYTKREKDLPPNLTGAELVNALDNDHQQIRNIAEIIQKINPDIILLNEFDNVNNENGQAIRLFIDKYLNISQSGQDKIHYPYYYLAPVNSGIKTSNDLNGDGKKNLPSDAHGFGYFPGHYGMVLLSKYPIDIDDVRTFQKFKWSDMPGALKPIDPTTDQSWYTEAAWQELRLSSKSHWDIPVKVNNQTIHLLASHPTPPVFDGPEDRNGKRNHDEIRFWNDYISGDKGAYIYDDKSGRGGIKDEGPFVILGDLNASATEGDANKDAISALLSHINIQDPVPLSKGGANHTNDNPHAKHHTAYWRMRADYVIPSKSGFKLLDSGVFWPESTDNDFRLIKNRQTSSDHRLVWVDVELTK